MRVLLTIITGLVVQSLTFFCAVALKVLQPSPEPQRLVGFGFFFGGIVTQNINQLLT
jgi:hypothetical protein